jgi:NAD-dependent dihydropyrimidine dehydrogenase PreA subunit
MRDPNMPLLNQLREKFPWFPTIDPEACREDLGCLNFCPHDVFEWDSKTGRPIVAHPLRCLPGCEICLEGCDTGALSFPSKREFHLALKKYRHAEKRTSNLRSLP